jgi:hypothetical protein
MLGQRGIRTNRGRPFDNRRVDYILHNPCYIGKIRWSLDGTRAVNRLDFHNEKIMTINGHHEPLISIELWDKVQELLEAQTKKYPKYARQEQPIQYMLKGLVRCDTCGGSMVMSAAVSGKAKTRTVQCRNYSSGACHVSHSITIPKLESTFREGLRKVLETKEFVMAPAKPPKQSDPSTIDYDKLITVEERRLARAKEAYLAEIDTIEQYGQNKKEITERIEDLKVRRDKHLTKEIDFEAFAKKVEGVAAFIEREDVTNAAKNEALRTIIEKIVFEKAKGNLAIYFHDI